MQNAEGREAACPGLKDLLTGEGKQQTPHPVSSLCRDLCRPQPLQPGHKLFPAHPQAASQGRGMSSEQGFPR